MSLVWHPFPLLKSCGHSIYLFIHFPSKVLAFETSLPIRISIDPLWGAYWYCLEPHIENHTFEYHKCWLVTKKHIIWFDVFILFNFLQVLLQQHSSKTKGILSYEIKIRDCFLVRYIWGIWFSFPLFIIFFWNFCSGLRDQGYYIGQSRLPTVQLKQCGITVPLLQVQSGTLQVALTYLLVMNVINYSHQSSQ